jgi:hypothetical protein
MRTLAVLAVAALCASCGSVSDPAGFAVVTQDKFDFMSCPEITAQRANYTVRVKDLSELAAKAESAPGGFIASYAAYRSELTQARALLAAANRAAEKNSCDTKK